MQRRRSALRAIDKLISAVSAAAAAAAAVARAAAAAAAACSLNPWTRDVISQTE